MATQRLLLKSSTIRVLVVGGSSLALGSIFYSDKHNDWNGQKLAGFTSTSHYVSPSFPCSMQNPWSTTSLFEPNRTTMEASNNFRNKSEQNLENPIKPQVYDFVVIGNGNAGQSAVKCLRQRCPKATIAVIHPFRGAASKSKNSDKSSVYYRDTVTSFNPKTKKVWLMNDSDHQIQYKYGMLVATGARGAPPPLELFEDSSLSRVVELRTTEIMGNNKRPVMPPERVRAAVVKACTAGGKVVILGSGWEALDLLSAAERVGRKKPTIVFGNPGPAWNILPQYLSSELRKKLVKCDIDILDRSVVRYVADTSYANSKKIELHTAKVYDLLETRRTLLDLLVLAPDSFGTKGTAAIPTRNIPDHMKSTSDGRPWYQTWSQLSKPSEHDPSVVTCFEDDGRLAVNAELCAASRVYAAGSVAKYPNSTTGQASVAGEGSINGSEAGRVAAINMSQEYLARQSTFSRQYDDEVESFANANSSLPVWRSDIASYPGQGAHRVVTDLSSFGIQALCVGNCDSERLDTRGFWWTNSSAQRKIIRLIDEEEAGDQEESAPSLYRRARRRLSRQRRRMGLSIPVYGIGVVFYLDSNGQIRGVMTWGMPFAEEQGGTLNPHLLHSIQHTIATNAGVSALDAREKHQIMNIAMAKQTQKFVSLAFREGWADATARWHGLDGPVEEFSTPLYRYTEVDAVTNATLRVLKRKDGGGLGVLGEDLYARDDLTIRADDERDENEAVPANVPTTSYPVNMIPVRSDGSSGSKTVSKESADELNRYLAVQRQWEDNDNRARPGKEDPLWLRPGDERRNTSQKQMIIDAYKSIMFPHRTS